MNEKHFDEWIKLKEKLHTINRIRTIHEGDVWWCAMGENVGVEINGKNEGFTRPAVVFRKLSRYSFLGIPLSTKFHEGNYYASFFFNGKQQTAALHQIRSMSVARLNKRMGELPEQDFQFLREKFIDFILAKNSPQTT